MSSILHSVSWRNHRVLENYDENDSPQPDKFRKIPSSSSLNTLRMSLRKRLPLKQVEVNFNAMPSWDSVAAKEKQRPLQAMTVTAKNMFGAMSQKIQKTRQNQNQYLLVSPDRVKHSRKEKSCPPGSGGKCTTPRTPRCRKQTGAASPRATPKSSKRITPCNRSARRVVSSEWRSFSNLIGKDGLNLRRSVRAAALKSPYSSPATFGRRRQFDKDLETVSTGIRQLKRLSWVFDDAILKEERKEAILNYHNLMANNLRCVCRPRPSWRRSTRRLQHTLGGWTGMALTSISNIGAH
ncbi:protein PIMREG isoform X1 [Ascaphus truei]|uniref:protein PIMREG isoform X1 n=1 Tax=Ascaphus truei TaxID=8439 RepID=UPI003F590CED